jgi:hypothetical protein
LSKQLGVEEVAIVPWAHRDEARRNSYSEIARAVDM